MELLRYFKSSIHTECFRPSFAHLNKRKASFDLCLNGNINPQLWAEAGFIRVFIPGVSDACQCFCCGLILSGWERGDDPWAEHAKHEPRCSFLYLHKGYPFIREYSKGSVPITDRDNVGTTNSCDCVVCMDNKISTVFLPCEHACCCPNCASALESCPLCRTQILYSFRILLP